MTASEEMSMTKTTGIAVLGIALKVSSAYKERENKFTGRIEKVQIEVK